MQKDEIVCSLFESYATIHSSCLQNLCVAAAYRPVHELLEEEKKVLMLF